MPNVSMYHVHNFTLSFLFAFLGWGKTESIWYVDQYLASCTSPGSWMMMSVEESVE
jgi:hypothetical protein